MKCASIGANRQSHSIKPVAHSLSEGAAAGRVGWGARLTLRTELNVELVALYNENQRR